MKTRPLFFVIAGSILTFAILNWFNPGIAKQRLNARFALVQRYVKIRSALQQYAWEHDNKLPITLSDLVPKYISQDQLVDCVYVGATGIQREVLAYEGEGTTGGSLAERQIISPDFGVFTVTTGELQQLLHGGASEVLERLRKSRVVYYEANLHSSLNCYRTKFGTYPNGTNASVTSVLRGQNSARERFHSSYDQERNSRGEDLDPWGRPYWIESDGNQVRMKSAGPNRQFDQPASSINDDICFSIAGGSVIGKDTKF